MAATYSVLSLSAWGTGTGLLCVTMYLVSTGPMNSTAIMRTVCMAITNDTSTLLEAAMIATDSEPPGVGTRLVVEARLGRQTTHVRLPGVVRWARQSPRGGFLFGVSFDGIGPDAQKVLEGIVEDFRRWAAQIQ